MICRSKPDKGDECNTETHSHEVHQSPVAGQHPHTDHLVRRELLHNQHNQQNKVTIANNDQGAALSHPDGDGDGEKFSKGESSAEAERDLPFRGGTRLHQVLGSNRFNIWHMGNIYMDNTWVIHGQ